MRNHKNARDEDKTKNLGEFDPNKLEQKLRWERHKSKHKK